MSIYQIKNLLIFFLLFIAQDFLSGRAFAQEALPKKPGCILPFHLISNADFTEIPMEQIQSAVKLPARGYSGLGHDYLGTGAYQGVKVFIKFPSRQNEMNLRQERYTKLLSDHEIGPKFFGVVHDGPRHRGIVTEFVQGFHVNPDTQTIPPEINLSMATYHDVLRIKQKLMELGLVDGQDIQLRIREKDGKAFLIDPEFLKFHTGDYSRGTPMAIQEIDEILLNVKRNLIQRNLWNEN